MNGIAVRRPVSPAHRCCFRNLSGQSSDADVSCPSPYTTRRYPYPNQVRFAAPGRTTVSLAKIIRHRHRPRPPPCGGDARTTSRGAAGTYSAVVPAREDTRITELLKCGSRPCTSVSTHRKPLLRSPAPVLHTRTLDSWIRA